MRFLGLDWVTLTLLFASSGAWLAFLYRRRRPPRRVVVPSLARWLAAVTDARVIRRGFVRSSWLSLLVALCIAASLVLALGEPSDGVAAGRDIVFLIDARPAMAARDVTPTRLARARSLAKARIDKLGDQDHAWVVALADSAVVVAGRTSDRAALRRAVDSIELAQAGAAWEEGRDLARKLLAPYPHGDVETFGDELGTSARNVAITALSARPYLLDHTHRELLVRIENFGPFREPLTLRVFAGDVLLREERLALSPHEGATRLLGDLPTAGDRLRAALTLEHGADLLPADDHAALDATKVRPVRVLVVTRGDRYLEAALLLDDTLAVRSVTPESYRDARGFDLVVFDAFAPATAPEVPALYFASTTGTLPLVIEGQLARPVIDRVDGTDPLVDGLAFRDVNIAAARKLRLESGDHSVLATSRNEPMLVEGERGGLPFLLFAFDLRETDLPLRAAFPLLFMRSVERLTTRVRGPAVLAAALPREGTDITPQARAHGTRAEDSAAHEPRRQPLWAVLLFVSWTLLSFEWWSYHRGWTS